jgi:hypothetical protein
VASLTTGEKLGRLTSGYGPVYHFEFPSHLPKFRQTGGSGGRDGILDRVVAMTIRLRGPE